MQEAPTALSYHPSGELLFVGTALCSVLALADADGARISIFALPTGVTAPLVDMNEDRSSNATLQCAITALQCSPNSEHLAAGLSNGRIALLDVQHDGSLRAAPPPAQSTRPDRCLVLLVS